MVRVVEVDDLGNWVDAWDRLAAEAPLPTPFSRSWWLTGVAGPEACFVLVLDEDELIGGLALERVAFPGLSVHRMLGAGKLCPDHLDLLAEAGRRDEVVAALREWFTDRARLLDLDGIREDAWLLDVLPGARVSVEDLAVHEPLPATMADYMAARSKSFGKRSRKLRRRVEESDVTFRRVPADEIPVTLESFIALHTPREDRRELVRHLPRLRRAVLAGGLAGEVHLWVAERHGVTGAVLMLFVTAGRVGIYQTARSLDPGFNHVGTVLDLLAIETACEEQMTDFDFLRGAEPYKFSFASRHRNLLRVRAAHGPLAHLALRGLLLATRIRVLAGVVRRRIRAISEKS